VSSWFIDAPSLFPSPFHFLFTHNHYPTPSLLISSPLSSLSSPPSPQDDPQWLPLGKACGAKRRHGKNKCERHRKGFLSFAGGGPNSRRIEMFVSLADTGHGGDGKQATHEVKMVKKS